MTSTAPKRNQMQILRDRNRITELMLQGYTHQRISEALYEETGIQLSRSMITKEVNKIKKQWRERADVNYGELLNRELARIDMTEKEVWRAWIASCGGLQKETVERVAAELSKDNGVDDLALSRVTTIVEGMGGAGEPRFLNNIIELQKERRRILGLYAPARLGIDIREKKELVIKGYAIREISPDAWPDSDIIEGQISEPQNVLSERTNNGK